MHHLEMRNLALVLSRYCFPGAQAPECPHPLHPDVQRWVAEQRALALHPIHHNRPLPQDSHKSAVIYKALLDSKVVAAAQKKELSRKIKLLFPGERVNAGHLADNLMRNARLIPSRTPNHLRFHLLRLLYNAAPTSHRTRRWNGTGTKPCHLCGDLEDSSTHLYFLCPTVLKAKKRALEALCQPSVPDSFPDSLLLGKATKFSAQFFMHFNFAVWVVRRWCTGGPPDPFADRTITDYTLASLAQLRKKDSERARTAALKMVLKGAKMRSRRALYHLELTKISPQALVVYTDGSANPNPGPAGAGAVCLDPPSAWVTALGHTTNNAAEIHAVGMAILAYGCHLRAGQALVIVLDSQVAFNALRTTHKVSANQTLARAVRTIIRAAHFRVEFILAPSHAGIRGNEAADRVAAHGAVLSRNLGRGFPARTDFRSCAQPMHPPDWDWWAALPEESFEPQG